MAVETKQKGVAPGGASLFSTIVTYGALALLNAIALTLIYGLLDMGNVPLAVVLGIIAFGATIIFFVPRFYPIRWMVPGLAFMILLVLYPIYFTVSNAFTNYGDGHLYAKQQSINLITARKYVPAEANVYRWEVMQADDGRYALYLTREVNGVLEAAFAPEGDPIEVVAEPTAEAPETYNAFAC